MNRVTGFGRLEGVLGVEIAGMESGFRRGRGSLFSAVVLGFELVHKLHVGFRFGLLYGNSFDERDEFIGDSSFVKVKNSSVVHPAKKWSRGSALRSAKVSVRRGTPTR